MSISLKFMIKPSLRCGLYIAICLVLSLPLRVIASELNESALQVHGFLAQGVIDVDGSNYVTDDQELSFRLTEIGLNASYKMNYALRVAAQGVYLNGGNRYHEGLRLDYLLLDWDAYHNEHWQMNVYLGRFKNNHWLYSGTRDIPFARPSIILPQAVYFDGFRDIAVGGDGAALKLTYSDGRIGELDINVSRGESAISSDQADVVIGRLARGKVDHDLDQQASIYWRPFASQWQFGLSLLDSTFNYSEAQQDVFVDSDFTFQFYTFNALYEGEYWQFSGELLQERFVTEGFYSVGFKRDEIGQGFSLQSRYKLSADLTILARYERFYANKDDKNGTKLSASSGGMIPSYFGVHNATTLGFSYDISNRMRINAEYHWFEGGARLSPIVLPNPLANNQRYWQVWAVQLMYWF